MKKLVWFLIAFSLGGSLKAQTNTGILQFILDVNQMTGTCRLAGVDSVYMHSGLGWSNVDSVWETIVGNWGIADGKGAMTKIGADSFSICFNVVEYYTQQADPDSTHVGGVGYGPMPTGATPYNIGAVFRTASCPLGPNGKPKCTDAQTGKDENCQNIFIQGINDPVNMQVLDNSGTPYSALTVQYITACTGSSSGIDDVASGFSSIKAYPVPFVDQVRIDFTILAANKPRAEIFDMLGQKVADLSNAVRSGLNSLVWNGRDSGHNNVPAGIYMYKISNGRQAFSGKIIKQ